MSELRIDARVALAPLTTFELGGPAEHFARIEERDTLFEALRWARAAGHEVTVLGGGSNLVVSDRGVSGLVLAMATRGVEVREQPGHVELCAQAGESWDELVARAVEQDLAGLECLSGIPGLVGATPIQNVGAYGQEVSDVIAAVEVLDRESLEIHTLDPSECGFGYRQSVFKEHPERYLLLSVSFALHAHGDATLRYPELRSALQPGKSRPSLREVRNTVLSLRRKKSMLWDAEDENHRSAGSFFTNPLVSAAQAEQVVERALAQGLVSDAREVPRYKQSDGSMKLAAAWLIERAGVRKAERAGHFGVSSRHALCLVHHGGGKSAELIDFARSVRARVQQTFGVTLTAEPVFLGFVGNPFNE